MIEGVRDALLVERFVQCFVEFTEQRYDAGRDSALQVASNARRIAECNRGFPQGTACGRRIQGVGFIVHPMAHGVLEADIEFEQGGFVVFLGDVGQRRDYRRLLDGLIVDEIELIARVRTELVGNI